MINKDEIMCRIYQCIPDGISVSKWAASKNIDPEFIYRLTKTDRRNTLPNTNTMIKLAIALDVSLDWLLLGVGEKKSKLVA